jgi:hypothetical protein
MRNQRFICSHPNVQISQLKMHLFLSLIFLKNVLNFFILNYLSIILNRFDMLI